MNIAELFKIVHITPEPSDIEEARSLTTQQLKDLWDSWNGVERMEPVCGETVHRVLNERGEGKYCAV